MNDSLKVLYYDLKNFSKAKLASFIFVLMPLIFGFIFIGVVLDLFVENSAFLASAFIFFALLMSSSFNIMFFAVEKEFGLIKEILVSPIGKTNFILGKLLSSMVFSLFSPVVLLIYFSSLKFVSVDFFLAAIILVLTSIYFNSLSFILSMLTNKLQSFQLIAMLFSFYSIFFTNSIFPSIYFQFPIRQMVLINPFTYGLDSLRFAFNTFKEFDTSYSLGILFFCAVVSVTLCVFVFNKKYS